MGGSCREAAERTGGGPTPLTCQGNSCGGKAMSEAGSVHDLPEIGKTPEIFEEVTLPAARPTRSRSARAAAARGGYGGRHGGGDVMAVACDPVSCAACAWERWRSSRCTSSPRTPPSRGCAALDAGRPRSARWDHRGAGVAVWSRDAAPGATAGRHGHHRAHGALQGCAYPMVGGATVMAVGPRDRYVSPAMAGVGEDVVVTKGRPSRRRRSSPRRSRDASPPPRRRFRPSGRRDVRADERRRGGDDRRRRGGSPTA